MGKILTQTHTILGVGTWICCWSCAVSWLCQHGRGLQGGLEEDTHTLYVLDGWELEMPTGAVVTP